MNIGAPVTTKLLVVDNDPLIRMGTAVMLRDFGYHVDVADGAAHALRLIGDGLVPDVLVSDYEMPGLTGIELARQIERANPAITVLLMSGHSSLGQLPEHWRLLAKPFTTAELHTAIESALSHAH